MSDAITTEWEQSAAINELAAALAKAQGEMKNAKKSADNPFFKSKYADLAEVTDACREPLTKNNIAVIQGTVTRENKCGVRTMLAHASGQYFACTALAVPKDNGPQATGSVWTYLRRYSLAAMTGVATEDDDGEKAEGRDKNAKPPGANWGKAPANERAAPKARTTDPADDGTPISPGTLEDLRFAATAKFPKGKTAKAWLFDTVGSDDPAALSEFEGQKALKALSL